MANFPSPMTGTYKRGFGTFHHDGPLDSVYTESSFLLINRSRTRTATRLFWTRATGHIDYLHGGSVRVSWSVEPAICVSGIDPQGGWNACHPTRLNHGVSPITATIEHGVANYNGGSQEDGVEGTVYANATLRVCHRGLCQQTLVEFLARVVP